MLFAIKYVADVFCLLAEQHIGRTLGLRSKFQLPQREISNLISSRP